MRWSIGGRLWFGLLGDTLLVLPAPEIPKEPVCVGAKGRGKYFERGRERGNGRSRGMEREEARVERETSSR